MIDVFAGLDGISFVGRLHRILSGGERVEFTPTNGGPEDVQGYLRSKGVKCGGLRPGNREYFAITVEHGKKDFAESLIQQWNRQGSGPVGNRNYVPPR